MQDQVAVAEPSPARRPPSPRFAASTAWVPAAAEPTISSMSALSQHGASADSAVARAAAAPERGDAGRTVFGHAARLLAAAKALEATALAPGTASAVGPTLACIEASLGARAQVSERLREQALQSTASSSDDRRLRPLRSETMRRFDRLCAALEEGAAACAAARARGERNVPASRWLGA